MLMFPPKCSIHRFDAARRALRVARLIFIALLLSVAIGQVPARADAPIANPDSGSTDEDTVLNVAAQDGVLANDYDPDGDPLTVTGHELYSVQGATIDVNADGSYSYNPTGAANLQALAEGDSIDDTFTYTVGDGTGETGTAIVTVTVTGINDAPTAVDNQGIGFVTDEDSPFDTFNVLDNDTDPDAGDTLSVNSIDTTSTTGHATDNGDGTFNYDPDGQFDHLRPGQAAQDTFTYVVGDDYGGSDSAIVRIAILGVNDLPVAVDDIGSTNEDAVLAVDAPGVLGNDDDPDGDPLQVDSYDAASAQGAKVSVNKDGSYTYDPTSVPAFQALAVGDSVVDTFNYTVGDSHGGSDTAIVRITVQGVNDPPIAVDDVGNTNEDAVLAVGMPGVLGNDTDVEGHPLNVTAYDATSVQEATVVVNAIGSYTYNPIGAAALQALAAGDSIVDTFRYTVGDGDGGTAAATVHVTVQGVNDPPTAYDDWGAGYTTDEDTPFTTGNVLDNDIDPDTNDSQSVIDVDATSMLGQLTDNSNGTFGYSPNGQFEALGIGDQIVETFTYTISDEQGARATASVSITINGVNDAPVAADNGFLVAEDSTSNILYVLFDDTDIENDPLTISGVSPPIHGTAVLTRENTALSYTPDPDFYGYDSFTYTISDGHGGSATAKVNIQVYNVNDNPRAQDDPVLLAEDSVANVIDALANDTYLPDPEETLTIASATPASFGVLSIASDGSHLTYTPNPNFYGTDAFTYTIIDGNGGTANAAVEITVYNVNDNPLAGSDHSTLDEDSTDVKIDVLINDTYLPDPFEKLTITQATHGAHGAVRMAGGNGWLTYTPDPDYYGQDKFTYTIADGNGGFATGNVTVQVRNVNDDPLARRDTATIVEDSGVNEIDVLINDTYLPDPEEMLTIVGFTSSQHGTVAIVDSSASLTYRPNPDYYGTDAFAYTITDGNGGYYEARVDVTVTGINDRPTAEDDSAATDEDTPVAIDVLKNDNDIDGALVSSSLQVTNGPAHGTTSVNASNGRITYTPVSDWSGHDSFDYRVCDSGTPLPVQCDTARVDVAVGEVNDLPVSDAGDDQTVDTLSIVTLDGSASYDPDGNLPLIYQWSQTGGLPHVTLSSTSAVAPTFVAPDVPAVLTFTLRVIDSKNQADLVPDEVVVTITNQPPVADAGDDQRVLVETTVTLNGSQSYDPDDPSGKRKLTYHWKQTGGLAVKLGDSAAPSPTFVAPDEPTVITFVLYVTDSFGEPALQSDQVVITVYKPYLVHMPLVTNKHVVGPDLVIRSMTATRNNVQLVIKNQGNAPVQNDFWIDVYINPPTAPTGVNQPYWWWNPAHAQGMAWWVSGQALAALTPGGSITLNRDDSYYAGSESNVAWPLPAGTVLYAQVDSYNLTNVYNNVHYGQVLETHEMASDAYNNIYGPVNSTAAFMGQTQSSTLRKTSAPSNAPPSRR